MNKAKVVRSLYFNAASLDCRNLAINQQLSAFLARQELCKSTKKVVPEAVKLSVAKLSAPKMPEKLKKDEKLAHGHL